jgi:hypothetical protein
MALAGPGPLPGAGLAFVTALAVHDRAEHCTSCEAVHPTATGGPEAAFAEALRYLDAYHANDHVRKVQSEVRGLNRGPAVEGALRPSETSAPLKVGAA